MVEFEEVDYAAVITVELPGMGQPATVTLTLRPPDAVEVGSGEVKPLRECTLADLQGFADALETELSQAYRAMTLSQLAATEEAKLKITILGATDEPLSAAQKQWLKRETTAEEDSEEATGDGERTAPQAATEAAAESASGDEEDGEVEQAAGEDESKAPATSAPSPADEEPAGEDLRAMEEQPADAKSERAVAETTSPGSDSDVGGDVPEVGRGEEEASAAPAPVETPVVEGAEPTVAPVPAPSSEDDVRVAGLRRPPGHATPAAVDILINEPAFRETQEHALSSLEREVAGMLVGPQPEKQLDGRYVVHITDAIAARHTRMSGASVTYTPESWRYVTDVLDERYPNGEAVIVGWYHTHPGFGIFLSGMDLFIHQHFFTQSWHVALVLDPQASRSGFFCWNRQQTAVQPYDFPWPRWAAGAW